MCENGNNCFWDEDDSNDEIEYEITEIIEKIISFILKCAQDFSICCKIELTNRLGGTASGSRGIHSMKNNLRKKVQQELLILEKE